MYISLDMEDPIGSHPDWTLDRTGFSLAEICAVRILSLNSKLFWTNLRITDDKIGYIYFAVAISGVYKWCKVCTHPLSRKYITFWYHFPVIYS